MGERLTVSIDYCPQCRGIWLEKGKLDQIISLNGSSSTAQNQGNVEGQRAGYYSKHDDHDHHDHHHDDHNSDYRKKKKKSFFEELF